MVQVRAKCRGCGDTRVIEVPIVAPANDNGMPLCHGAPMEVLGPLFPPRTNPDEIVVSILEVREPPPEECADWKNPRQVWFLKPGRQGGEKLGWIGEGFLSWKYLMVAGVRESFRRGLALSRPRAINAMLVELDR